VWPAAVAIALFTVLGVLIRLRVAVPGDAGLVRSLHGHRRETATEFFLDVDAASDAVVVGVAAAVVALAFAAQRRPPAAALFVVAFAVPVLANPLLKQLFARARPSVAPAVDEVSRYGFPAGHAVAAAAFFGALLLASSAARRRWLLPAALVVSALIGFAELYLGRHYPTDLVAGWALAAAWVFALSGYVAARPQLTSK
jgi:undecaprenyl-diphosphatase